MRRLASAPMDGNVDIQHWIGHSISAGALLGALTGLIPALAALIAVIYYIIQIYESDTVQKYLDKRRRIWKARRVAKLRAQQKVLLAELEALEVIRVARDEAADKVAVATSEAAALLVNQKAHEKIHGGGAVIKSTPADGQPDRTASDEAAGG